ncbi:MAG: hypothetical protein AAFX87_27645, partial [Bacteroidota bacterium]
MTEQEYLERLQRIDSLDEEESIFDEFDTGNKPLTTARAYLLGFTPFEKKDEKNKEPPNMLTCTILASRAMKHDDATDLFLQQVFYLPDKKYSQSVGLYWPDEKGNKSTDYIFKTGKNTRKIDLATYFQIRRIIDKKIIYDVDTQKIFSLNYQKKPTPFSLEKTISYLIENVRYINLAVKLESLYQKLVLLPENYRAQISKKYKGGKWLQDLDRLLEVHSEQTRGDVSVRLREIFKALKVITSVGQHNYHEQNVVRNTQVKSLRSFSHTQPTGSKSSPESVQIIMKGAPADTVTINYVTSFSLHSSDPNTLQRIVSSEWFVIEDPIIYPLTGGVHGPVGKMSVYFKRYKEKHESILRAEWHRAGYHTVICAIRFSDQPKTHYYKFRQRVLSNNKEYTQPTSGLDLQEKSASVYSDLLHFEPQAHQIRLKLLEEGYLGLDKGGIADYKATLPHVMRMSGMIRQRILDKQRKGALGAFEEQRFENLIQSKISNGKNGDQKVSTSLAKDLTNEKEYFSLDTLKRFYWTLKDRHTKKITYSLGIVSLTVLANTYEKIDIQEVLDNLKRIEDDRVEKTKKLTYEQLVILLKDYRKVVNAIDQFLLKTLRKGNDDDRLNEAKRTKALKLESISGSFRRIREVFEKHPDALTLPAIFYPDATSLSQKQGADSDTLTNENYQTDGYRTYFYLYKEKGYWVLRDASQQSAATNKVAANDEEVPYLKQLEALFEYTKAKERFPKGVIKYRYPVMIKKEGRKELTYKGASQVTTADTSLAEWLAKAGMFVGLTAATLASLGTAPMIVSGFVVVGGALSVTSGVLELKDKDAQGRLKSRDFVVNGLMIAADLATMNMGGGKFAKAIIKIRGGDKIVGTNAIRLANFERYALNASKLTGGTALLVFTDEVRRQMKELDKIPNARERQMAYMRFFGTMASMFAIQIVAKDPERYEGNKISKNLEPPQSNEISPQTNRSRKIKEPSKTVKESKQTKPFNIPEKKVDFPDGSFEAGLNEKLEMELNIPVLREIAVNKKIPLPELLKKVKLEEYGHVWVNIVDRMDGQMFSDRKFLNDIQRHKQYESLAARYKYIAEEAADMAGHLEGNKRKAYIESYLAKEFVAKAIRGDEIQVNPKMLEKIWEKIRQFLQRVGFQIDNTSTDLSKMSLAKLIEKAKQELDNNVTPVSREDLIAFLKGEKDTLEFNPSSIFYDKTAKGKPLVMHKWYAAVADNPGAWKAFEKRYNSLHNDELKTKRKKKNQIIDKFNLIQSAKLKKEINPSEANELLDYLLVRKGLAATQDIGKQVQQTLKDIWLEKQGVFLESSKLSHTRKNLILLDEGKKLEEDEYNTVINYILKNPEGGKNVKTVDKLMELA